MNKNLLELQSQMARISAELAEAQRTIRTLDARKAGRSPAAMWVGIVVTIAALTSWGSYAQQTPASIPATPGGQILDLLRRVTALEQSKNKVAAPFDVVDSAGKPILHVSGQTKGDLQRGIYLCNNAGKNVAWMNYFDGLGSVIAAYSDAQDQHASLYCTDLGTGVGVFQGKTHLADLKISGQGGLLSINAKDGTSAVIGVPEDRSTMGLRIKNESGYLAAVSINKDSPTGAVSIAGADGKVAASMEVIGNEPVVAARYQGKTVAALGAEPDGRGYFAAFYNDQPTAMLTTSDENAGAGRLTLNAPGGGWAVRAGYSGSHGDVCVGGAGAEGKLASHCLWGSAVVGSLAK